MLDRPCAKEVQGEQLCCCTWMETRRKTNARPPERNIEEDSGEGEEQTDRNGEDMSKPYAPPGMERIKVKVSTTCWVLNGQFVIWTETLKLNKVTFLQWKLQQL